MKIRTIAFYLFFISLLTMNVSGATVYIRGTVTDLQGVTPVANHTIYIKTDFSSPFHYYKILYTDLHGYYADTVLNVPSFPISIQISTYDCDNVLQVKSGLSTNSPIIADFQICVPPVSNCHADFTYDSISGLNYQFTDQSSSNTSILTWNWNFGDPASGTSNITSLQNPQHLYSGAGIYNVKLGIHSHDGCRDSIVQTVFIGIPHDRVIISGHITNDSTGEPVADHPVMINTTLIQYSEVKYTDADGFYADTIPSVPHGIPISVASYDCHNVLHSNTVYASATPLQVDFTLCSNTQCFADFVAALDSNNQSENTFLFTDRSYGHPDHWNWSFGDGSYSHDQNPVHQYTTQGTYNVCLFILKDDTSGSWVCSDTICQLITTSSYHNLGGLLFTGLFPINNPHFTGDTGIAVLYRKHNQWVAPVDTILFTYLGYYIFLHVMEGSYIVKAGLTQGSANYNKYLPAYTGNQVTWQTTTTFLLDQDLFNNDIHLFPANDSLSGPAVLRGSVIHNGDYAKLPGSEVLLFNANLEPVRSTVADAEGNYEFGALPFGTYSLYPEIAGKYARVLEVTVDSSHTIAEGLDLEVFDYDITGVFPVQPQSEVKIGKLFPNPVNDVVSVTVTSRKPMIIFAEAITVTGVRVWSGSFGITDPIKTISFPLNIQQGLYFLVLRNQDGSLLSTQKMIRN
ncbi:MAG: PKD domain-containing protein [Bacteroidetes bacterium]|nr:PKD domain-containing protein [Bacteroidota bacterium]